jgi:hypothetical protein
MDRVFADTQPWKLGNPVPFTENVKGAAPGNSKSKDLPPAMQAIKPIRQLDPSNV